MATLTYEEFWDFLLMNIERTVDFVQAEVAEPLSKQYCLELAGFGQDGKESSIDEVMSFLYVNGTYPVVIDIGVRGITGKRTVIWLRPSGHPFVKDLESTWNHPPSIGPFKPIGLFLPPSVSHRPRPLTRYDLEEATPKWANKARCSI